MAAHNVPPSPVKVAAVVAFYMVAALIMVFVNKAVLNSTPELPLLFLFLQLVLAVILLHTTALLDARVEIPARNWHTAKMLVPVVSVNVIGLVFNTLCLRDVDASFFQIARGMQLPLTIAVSALHTRAAPSPRVLLAALLVAAGFLAGVAPTAAAAAAAAAVPARALLYGVLSALFIAVHAVLIKSALPHCGGSAIQLAYWTNAGSAIALAPAVLLAREPARAMALSAAGARVFAAGSLVTGVCGFLLCVAGLLSIKVTSPVTHMFSSAARSVLQTLLAVWFFGDLLTVNRVVSILMILGATMYYTWVKHTEARAPPRSSDLEAHASAEARKPLFQEPEWAEKAEGGESTGASSG